VGCEALQSLGSSLQSDFAHITVQTFSHPKGRKLVSKDSEAVVSRLLERFASILLRLGFDSPRAESLIRQAFVFEAAKSARKNGARSTQSQIALIAGVNRLDVRKILAGPDRRRSAGSANRRSRVERILRAWCEDPMFANEQGRPKPLTFVGANSQFVKLVRKYGRDVTARTLREDLIRNKIASQRGTRLVLVKRGSSKDSSPAAALVDLNFLDSQLGQFDFSQGRRDFRERDLCLTTNDLKLLKLALRNVNAKIETTFSSLHSLKRSLSTPPSARDRRKYRLRIATVVSTESENSDD